MMLRIDEINNDEKEEHVDGNNENEINNHQTEKYNTLLKINVICLL